MSQGLRQPSRTVIVVGAGLVGLACAWLLQRRGHRVLLVESPAPGEGGSINALGVLMGQVFHRSGGRAWRLRQQSLTLWHSWRRELAGRGRPIACREGLLLVASDATGAERLRGLQAERRRRGLPLEWWPPAQLDTLAPDVPGPAFGALHSPLDGQLDPKQAMEALHSDGTACGLTSRTDTVVALERGGNGEGWRVVLGSGLRLESQWLVLCAGVDTTPLIEPLLHPTGGVDRPPLEPVLGQALEMELPAPVAANGWNWPGAVVWQGMNLVPRPDLPGGRRFWLGATLEPGRQGSLQALEGLRKLGGAAPQWLLEATERRRWQGLRARPVGRPAPWLEQLAPGLLVATGHYRNGILLAPATAEWVREQVEEA